MSLIDSRFSPGILLLSWLLIPASAWSLPEDNQAPVQIEADSADLDQARNITIYKGKVHIRQGSMLLLADKVEIGYKNNKPYVLTATGNRASLKQKPAKDEPWITGKGRRIVYYLKSDKVTLTGDAELLQEKDSFRSDRIVYDRKTGRLQAGSSAKGKQRVKVIIQSESLQ